MTGTERNEIRELSDAILPRLDAIESRLDRWDGAITFIKAAASFLGIGGVGLIIAAAMAAAK